jgi:hypothetical protein
MQECNKPFCNQLNWVQDQYDANHYTCLKCGRHLRVNTFNWGSLFEVVLQIIGCLFLVIVLLACDANDELAQSEEDTLIDSPKIIESNK